MKLEGTLLSAGLAILQLASPALAGPCYMHVRSSALLAVDAEAACQVDFGGHLASIHSLAEDDLISQLVDPNATGGITAHIGGLAPSGFCNGQSGVYAWTDGTPWDFENWRAVEPNCTSLPFGAIQFWPNTNASLSGWNDVVGDLYADTYVCKWECSCIVADILPIRQLLAIKSTDHLSVVMSFSNDANADSYNVWYVTQKQQIPVARQGGPGLNPPGCAQTTSPSCVHQDAAPPMTVGPLLFYQVRGVCQGLEAPQ